MESEKENASRRGQGLVPIGELTKHLPGKNISAASKVIRPSSSTTALFARMLALSILAERMVK